MNRLNTTDFQPATLAIVDALMDAALDDAGTQFVGEEALARFACGWITPEERAAVIAALTVSSEMRERLVELRAALRRAEESPEARNEVFRANKALKSAMQSAFKSSVQVMSNWTEACQKGPRKGSESDQRSLRSILVGIGRRLEPRGQAPAFAATRGAALSKVMVEPGNVSADLEVAVEPDDRIIARAKFSKPFSEPREISMYVIEQGGAWSWIGSNIARGSLWDLETPEYASMLGLEPGEQISQRFALSEGRWFLHRGWVPLKVSDELSDVGSPTRLRLRKPPMVRDGNFVIGFEMPDSIREAFSKERLTLSIDFSSASFVLGSWNVKDLPPSLEVELSAPSMGVPDGEFEMHSAISLMLRPGL